MGPQGHGRGEENLASTGIRFADRPCHSESLYRLSCHSPQKGKFVRVKQESFLLRVDRQQVYCMHLTDRIQVVFNPYPTNVENRVSS